MPHLNAQQLDAVQHCTSHCLLLAGAGSGKTKTLVAKVAYLIEQGVLPSKLLLLTFTNRAANEMIERIHCLLPDQVESFEAGTFHTHCLRRIRHSPGVFANSYNSILDSADQQQLMRLIVADYKTKHEIDLPKIAEIISTLSAARSRQHSISKYYELFRGGSSETSDALSYLAYEYTKQKQERGYFDFDDLLECYLEMLRGNEDFCLHESQRYAYILVDEMQDTNPLQWEILSLLRKSATLFVVGDDAQSIYAFRGADFKNVHTFTSRVPDSCVKYLTTNYRSTQAILNVSNWLLKDSSISYNKELNAATDIDGQLPAYPRFDNEWEEAEYITSAIMQHLANGIPASEILVLSRAAYLLRALEASLTRCGQHYKLVGGRGLFDRAHIKDLLAIVRLLTCASHDLSWMHFLMLWPGIGEKTAFRAAQKLKEITTLKESLPILTSLFKKKPEILECVTNLAQISGSSSEQITAVIALIEPILCNLNVYKRDWHKRRRDLPTIAQAAKRSRTLSAFLDIITLEAPAVESQEMLTLSTIHSAKGTEAEVCFVIQVQPGQYPHMRTLDNNDSIEEERRLLYVAMTRAKRYLYLTGLYVTAEVPFFFDDLPRELVRSY